MRLEEEQMTSQIIDIENVGTSGIKEPGRPKRRRRRL